MKNINIIFTAPHKGSQNDSYLIRARKNIPLVKLFLKYGADCNAQDRTTGDTHLTLAARMGWNEFANVLIEYKPDVKIKNNSEKTALIIAQETNNKLLLKKLERINSTPSLASGFVRGINRIKKTFSSEKL